jgi:hypothetical protein
MRSSDWIAALGLGATVFVSLGVSAEERPSGRDTSDCHAALKIGEKYATFRRYAVEGQ